MNREECVLLFCREEKDLGSISSVKIKHIMLPMNCYLVIFPRDKFYICYCILLYTSVTKLFSFTDFTQFSAIDIHYLGIGLPGQGLYLFFHDQK